LKQARAFFERALTLDPGDVDALLGRAAVELEGGRDYGRGDRTAHMAAAEATLTKVLSAAPDNARAHFELSQVETFSNRAEEGVAEAERALALDRNLAAAHAVIGAAKTFLGHPEETEPHIQEALRLSPRDPLAAGWMLTAGGAKLLLGAYEEAVTWERRAIEANPNFALAHFFLAAALGQLGRLDEARAAVKTGLTINPDFTIAHFRAETPSDNATFRAGEQNVYDGLRKAGVPEE
jgi:tetratricopeptide (TPR) repeat protein